MRAVRWVFFVIGMAAASVAQAQDIRVTIENLAPSGGFSLTPLWIGMHDGTFDLFDVGSPASPGLELIAEEGDASLLSMEFDGPGRLQASGIGNAMGFPGAPVIEPAEIAMGTLTPMNPASYPYFSFASMVIPSNDAFIGNGNPLAHRVFNADGSFAGPLTIEIFGRDIWDSGTEVNDPMGGAAFSTEGGTSTDENGVVQIHAGLLNFEGTGTPAGTIGMGVDPGADDLVARITITQVPEPSAIGLLALAGMTLSTLVRRRR